MTITIYKGFFSNQRIIMGKPTDGLHMTIYDISEKAGVSIATVSRVMNGSSNVSEKTKQKVLDVIKQYEYTPNVFARGLGLNTMKTIGILCADSSDLYIAKAIYYLERLLRANGYDNILCCSGYELHSKEKSMNLLITKKVDAIILVGSTYVHETPADNQYIFNAAAQVPVMLLNGILDIPNVYSIASNDYASVYDATRYLLHSGIHNILYYYPSDSYSGKRKIAGFQDAMKDANLPLTDAMIRYYPGDRENIPEMARYLKKIAETVDFDAVIAADDTLAMGAYQYALSAGLSIPEDLSIIGCNNSMLVNCCAPALTSIDNKLESLCEHLITTLMEVLGGNDMPKTTVVPGELILRGTTR